MSPAGQQRAIGEKGDRMNRIRHPGKRRASLGGCAADDLGALVWLFS
jgi:hypothetical protein